MIFKLSFIIIGIIILTIILPSLFGFNKSILTFALFSVILVEIGVRRDLIIMGTMSSFLTELILKFQFGSFTFPFLISSLFVYWLQSFFNISFGRGSQRSSIIKNFIISFAVFVIYCLSFIIFQFIFIKGKSALEPYYLNVGMLLNAILSLIFCIIVLKLFINSTNRSNDF